MKIVRHVCACVLITVFGMGMGSPARGQAGPYLASVWDSAINIPPGGYRAPKAIELHGKINITTTPWTTIDAVTFNGTQDSQHWKINGTVLRRVSIIGQIGVGLVAKDSVFEGCTFEKTGGWFVSMWGATGISITAYYGKIHVPAYFGRRLFHSRGPFHVLRCETARHWPQG